ncbi:MAG: hypothetical protein H7257_07285 [Taibaiella sp.]|nr:hypothetical protein [Taibaiella sp.]
MKAEKRSKNELTSWDTILDDKYGKVGTIERTELEIKCQAFIIEELLREEKSESNLRDLKLAEAKLAEARLVLPDLAKQQDSGPCKLVINSIPTKQNGLASKNVHRKSA